MSEEINTDHFSTMEELLEHLKNWERDDDIDAYYRFFSPGCAFELANKIKKQQKEIEEKNVAINKMSKDISRQLKEIEKLNFENHMLKKWNEQLDRNCISKDKIREKIKELENKNEENKIELAKGIDMLSFSIIEKAKNNILINMTLRDILKELLEEN